MNVINNLPEPRKVVIVDIPIGEAFLDHRGELFIRCSLRSVLLGATFQQAASFIPTGDAPYPCALHVSSGHVVSFSRGSDATPVHAEAVIKAKCKST